MKALRVLCYKPTLGWPRTKGHDVALFHLTQELAGLGVRVGLATATRPSDRALEGLPLDLVHALDEDPLPAGAQIDTSTRLTGLREKYRVYWGIPEPRVRGLAALARHFAADVVVASGLDALPMLGAVDTAARVWHAGDEWVLHHLSLMQATAPATWKELKPAAVKGLYEFAYGGLLDRIWVVTVPDQRAARLVARVQDVDILPNGVDVDAYRALDLPQIPESAVFWGRLDFEPNIQALEWFATKVWGRLRQRHPAATFSVMGFAPVEAVLALNKVPGMTVHANVPDLAPVVSSHQVVVLPIVTGAGIKNKLLEAAAYARPIVCTTRAMLGLRGTPPVVRRDTSAEFGEAVSALWSDPAERTRLGSAARDWVTREHTWRAAAQIALDGLERSVQARRDRTARAQPGATTTTGTA